MCWLASGRKILLSVLNFLGRSVSYYTMQRLRNRIARSQLSMPLQTKVVSSIMLKVACDNIGAKLAANVVRLVSKSLDWHGTVLISSQMPFTAPLLS